MWTGAENLPPTGIQSPDRPARSESLYRLSYTGARYYYYYYYCCYYYHYHLHHYCHIHAGSVSIKLATLALPTKGVQITSAFQALRTSVCSAAWSQGLHNRLVLQFGKHQQFNNACSSVSTNSLTTPAVAIRCKENGIKSVQMLAYIRTNLTLHSPVVTICTASLTFNNSTFCPHSCIYMFCVDLRTNSDYFPVQH